MNDFKNCLAKFTQKQEQIDTEFLFGTPFFNHWSKTQIKKILPSLKKVNIVKGQVLI
jgi:hypothetical protein